MPPAPPVHNCSSSSMSFIALMVACAFNYVMHWDFENSSSKMIKKRMLNTFSFIGALIIWAGYNAYVRKYMSGTKIDPLINAVILMIPFFIYMMIDLQVPKDERRTPYARSAVEKTVCGVVPPVVYLLLTYEPLKRFFCEDIIGNLENAYSSKFKR
jgi:cytochrome c oxidase assembly factor CtaG